MRRKKDWNELTRGDTVSECEGTTFLVLAVRDEYVAVIPTGKDFDEDADIVSDVEMWTIRELMHNGFIIDHDEPYVPEKKEHYSNDILEITGDKKSTLDMLEDLLVQCRELTKLAEKKDNGRD